MARHEKSDSREVPVSVISEDFLDWNQNGQIGNQSDKCRQFSDWRRSSLKFEDVVTDDGERNGNEELVE